MALLSHLDLVRLLERSLRRSGLPVSFTGGFHPLPRLQLALALPLGVEAEGEWMDLEFTEPVDPEDARESWQSRLPPGLSLLSAEDVPVSSASLSQRLAFSRWRFNLSSGLDQHRCSSEDWEEAIAQLLRRDELIWEDTDKKGRPRRRDFRTLLTDLRLLSVDRVASTPSAQLELIAAVDVQGRSLKPAQLCSWLAELLGCELTLSRVKRIELGLLQC